MQKEFFSLFRKLKHRRDAIFLNVSLCASPVSEVFFVNRKFVILLDYQLLPRYISLIMYFLELNFPILKMYGPSKYYF